MLTFTVTVPEAITTLSPATGALGDHIAAFHIPLPVLVTVIEKVTVVEKKTKNKINKFLFITGMVLS